MSKYDTIQPNGVCWDCGSLAVPVSNSTETQTTIGWLCGCGRFWPAFGDDVDNWAKAATSIGGISGNVFSSGDVVSACSRWISRWNSVQDVEGEIERGRSNLIEPETFANAPGFLQSKWIAEGRVEGLTLADLPSKARK